MPKPSARPSASDSLRVRVHRSEREALKRLADSLDQKSSRILRRMIREAITGGPDFFDDGLAELREAHRQLAAVGRNINQLARAANRDDPIVPSELRSELAEVKVMVDNLARLYAAAVEHARCRSVKPLQRQRAG